MASGRARARSGALCPAGAAHGLPAPRSRFPRSAFTLVELIVVITILAILGTV